MKPNEKKSNIKSINQINRDISDAKRSGRDIRNVSDGQYTFNEYIDIRNHLFVALCNAYPDISWKTKKLYNGENGNPSNNCFIAGINSPEGIISFHLDMEYWDDLKVIEIDKAPMFNGYTVEDVKIYLKSLKER